MKAFATISGALGCAYSFFTGDFMGAWLAWLMGCGLFHCAFGEAR